MITRTVIPVDIVDVLVPVKQRDFPALRGRPVKSDPIRSLLPTGNIIRMICMTVSKCVGATAASPGELPIFAQAAA